MAAPGLGTSEAACRSASADSRQKDKRHLKYRSDSCSMRNGNEHRQMLMCILSLPNAGEDCSHDALLVKTCTDWWKRRNPLFLSEDGHVSTSSPGRVQQKFTAHTIPQQLALQQYKHSNSDKKYPLTRTIIASKGFVFELRRLVSPPSLVFSLFLL